MNTAISNKSSAPLLAPNGSKGELTSDEFALRAFSIWEENGLPQNREFKNWLQAGNQLPQSRVDLAQA